MRSTSERLGPVAEAGSLDDWARGTLCRGLLGLAPWGAVAYAHGSAQRVGAALFGQCRSREWAERKALEPEGRLLAS